MIRNSENGTRVEIAADRSGAAVLTWLPASLGGFLSAAVAGAILEPSLAGGLGLMGVGLASGATVGWAIWRRNTARFKLKMRRLAEALRAALHKD